MLCVQKLSSPPTNEPMSSKQSWRLFSGLFQNHLAGEIFREMSNERNWNEHHTIKFQTTVISCVNILTNCTTVYYSNTINLPSSICFSLLRDQTKNTFRSLSLVLTPPSHLNFVCSVSEFNKNRTMPDFEDPGRNFSHTRPTQVFMKHGIEESSSASFEV